MSKRKRNTEQIIGVLKQLESGRTAAEMAREMGFQAHDLRVEVSVRRHGSERSRGAAVAAR